MTCNQVLSENLIERYLAGKLDEDARDDFELHYFDCESCLAMVQAVQVLRPVMAEMPAPPVPMRKARHWIWLAAAAAAITVVLLSWPRATTVSTPPPTTPAPVQLALLQLSDVQPAPYSATVYRGGNVDAEFAKAMELYQKRQWAEAAAALSKLENASPAARHFAGISYLLAGRTDAALAALEPVIAMGAKSPYEEEARYYRAQALLVAGKRQDGRAELERVIQLRGDYEAPARAILVKL